MFQRPRTPARRAARPALGTGAIALAAGVLVVSGGVGASATTLATAITIDFGAAGYTLADQSPAGQNDWYGYGHPVDRYDWALVDSLSFPAAALPAGPVFRFSNAINDTNQYGNITQLSSPVIAAAGETSTGATFDTFEATFTVASATGGIQPGLNVEIDVDGRDGTSGGSRAGGIVGLRHLPEGLQISTRWPVPGSPAELADWRNTSIVVPATSAHTITIRSQFVDDADDVVQVFVDGSLALTGSTWEGYHDAVAAPLTDKQVVNALLVRTSTSGTTPNGIGFATGVTPSGAEITALDGKGLLFDEISYRVFNTLPTDPPSSLPQTPDGNPDATLPDMEKRNGEAVGYTITGFDPYENVYAVWYSAPVFGGWFQANASGTLTPSLVVPAALEGGLHTLQFVGQDSGRVASGSVKVLALANSGADAVPLLVMAGVLIAAGVGLAGFGTLRTARRRIASSRS